jgi:hypothetical protein
MIKYFIVPEEQTVSIFRVDYIFSLNFEVVRSSKTLEIVFTPTRPENPEKKKGPCRSSSG